MKNVVLEGYKSAWSQRSYFPVLQAKAEKGDIALWAVDIITSPESDTIHYIDKIKEKDRYIKLANADFVFIVNPPQYHVEAAKFWLPRLTEGGKIFIEKPLDISVLKAKKFKQEIYNDKKEGSIFGFDHYLARSYLFLKNEERILQTIGGIESIRNIEFRILEDSPIPQGRKVTLDKGIIFDLFCHILAVVGATVSRQTYCSAMSIRAVEDIHVKAAKYQNAPIRGETFSRIDFNVNGINVEAIIGKCVGDSQDKSMIINGNKCSIELDFMEDEFYIYDSENIILETGKLNPNHVETFIEEVLDGKNPNMVPGVISFDISFEILELLKKTKKKIHGSLVEYKCGSTLEEILKLL